MAQSWRTIADSEVDPESPVTTSLAQAWRDNPEGIAGGVAGAPSVVNSALSGYPWGQGDLRTTTTTESAQNNGSVSIRNTAAGSWGMGFEQEGQNDNTSLDAELGAFVGRAGASATDWRPEQISISEDYGFGSYISLYASDNETGGGDLERVQMRVRYIQASPPYDMGDGECGLFITVDLDSEGKIKGVSLAPDPCWANNGPTNIRPDYTDKATGKKYKRIKRPQLCRDDLEAGRCDLDELISAKREAPVEDVEITPEFKNADMDFFPHSWVSPPQGTICMLDPVQTHDLLMLHEDGEDIADLLHKGFILPGGEVSRYGPTGVKMISFKWKRSKR